jgi:hypothetical protein
MSDEEKPWGVWAVRDAGSVFGAAEAWLKRDRMPERYDTEAEAIARAEDVTRRSVSPFVHYSARRFP